MAKRCQEEYEDVSEVLHPSTLSTLYMYVPWPRLNVFFNFFIFYYIYIYKWFQ